MKRGMGVLVIAGVLLSVLLLAACSSDSSTSSEGSTPATSDGVSSPTATTPTSPETITITGTVRDVSLSARIITLAEPVEGFEVVALTEGSELVSASGGEATLQDIRPGMQIKASGQAGEGGALLAEQVLVTEP
jgi:hypothetical protein